MYVGTWAATHGFVTPRRANSAHPSIVPFQAFATADGHIAIAAGKERFWRDLCTAIERPDLLEDPRYASFAARDEHRDALLADPRRRVRLPAAEPLAHVARRRGGPGGPRQRRRRGARGPQTLARDGVVAYEHPNLGTVRQAASPLRLSGELPEPSRAPLMGEHTDDLLRELLGYSDEQTAALREAGAFGEQVPQ